MSNLKQNIMETTVRTQTSEVSMFKVSGIVSLALIAFFLVMKLLKLNTIVELRFLNLVIMLFGVRYILLHRRAENAGKLEYLKGMITGFFTAFIAAIFFAVFIFLYLNLDPSFMQYLQNTQPFGNYLTPASASLLTVIEGTASGAIITFMLMHTLNKDSDAG